MTKQPFAIPTMEEAYPPLAALLARKNELDARSRELEHDLSRLRRGKAPTSALAAAAADRQSRAAELVGDLVETDRAAPRVRIDMEALRHQIQAELDATIAALGLVTKEAERAKGVAAIAVVDKVRPEYEAALRDLAKAIATAVEAHDRATAITADMTQAGTPWTGRLPQPMSLRSVFGAAGEADTRARIFLLEVAAAGLFKETGK